jgi:hypothetical protein
MLSRLRRVTDLFVRGREVALPDGSWLYIRVLNSFEKAEALAAAQAARARFTMALREGGEERVKIEALLEERGRDDFISQLADAHTAAGAAEVVSKIEVDAEWTERLDIVRRGDGKDNATPLDPAELELLAKISADFMAEIDRRQADERDFSAQTMQAMTDDELVEEWKTAWMEQRGRVIANAEYRITELWYATRLCEGDLNLDTGNFDHSHCGGHPDRLFPERVDVRDAPDDLQMLLANTLAEVEMGVSDPKGSPSPASSSDSSPPPSSPAVV